MAAGAGGLHLVEVSEFVSLLLRCDRWFPVNVYVSPAVDKMRVVGRRLNARELSQFKKAKDVELHTTVGLTSEQADTVWRWVNTLSSVAYAHPENPAFWMVEGELTSATSQPVYALGHAALPHAQTRPQTQAAAAATAAAPTQSQTTTVLATRPIASVKTSNFAKHHAYTAVLSARTREEHTTRLADPPSKAVPRLAQARSAGGAGGAAAPHVPMSIPATAYSAETLWHLAQNMAAAQLQLQLYQAGVGRQLAYDLWQQQQQQQGRSAAVSATPPVPVAPVLMPSLAQQRRTAGAAAAAAAAEADDVAARAFRFYSAKR